MTPALVTELTDILNNDIHDFEFFESKISDDTLGYVVKVRKDGVELPKVTLPIKDVGNDIHHAAKTILNGVKDRWLRAAPGRWLPGYSGISGLAPNTGHLG